MEKFKQQDDNNKQDKVSPEGPLVPPLVPEPAELYAAPARSAVRRIGSEPHAPAKSKEKKWTKGPMKAQRMDTPVTMPKRIRPNRMPGP